MRDLVLAIVEKRGVNVCGKHRKIGRTEGLLEFGDLEGALETGLCCSGGCLRGRSGLGRGSRVLDPEAVEIKDLEGLPEREGLGTKAG